jgi:hypothetical protein
MSSIHKSLTCLLSVPQKKLWECKTNLNLWGGGRKAIYVTCVTLTNGRWEKDNWPTFVQLHCSHTMAGIHKWQIYVTCSSHGYVALQYCKKGSLHQCFPLESSRSLPYCAKMLSTAPGSESAVLKSTDLESMNQHHLFPAILCLWNA